VLLQATLARMLSHARRRCCGVDGAAANLVPEWWLPRQDDHGGARLHCRWARHRKEPAIPHMWPSPSRAQRDDASDGGCVFDLSGLL